MLNWLKDLLFKRCPRCKSFRIVEQDVMTFTYNIYYRCLSCGYEWKESGL